MRKSTTSPQSTKLDPQIGKIQAKREQRGMLFSKGIGLGYNTPMTAPEGRGIKPSPRITKASYSQKLLHLCNDYNLSSYDATYLELADRKKPPSARLIKRCRLPR